MESEPFLFANKENLSQWNNLHKFLCTTEEPHKGPKFALHNLRCCAGSLHRASLQGKFQLWHVFAYLASEDLGKASCTQICTSGKRRGRTALVPLNECSSHLGKPPRTLLWKLLGKRVNVHFKSDIRSETASIKRNWFPGFIFLAFHFFICVS